MVEYKYQNVAEMYGADDLGNDPIFPGGYINYGFWKDTPLLAEEISYETRINASMDLYRKLFQNLEVQHGDTVIEVGCGKGYGLKLLSDDQKPNRIIGLDFSPHQAKRSLDTNVLNPETSVVIATAEKLPLATSSIDKAYSLEAMQHFQSGYDFSMELGRVVKPGGIIALSTFFATSKDAIPELEQLLPTVKRGVDKAYDIHDVQDWLKDAQFKDVNIESIGGNVWQPFVRWCEQAKPEEVSSNWLEAYQRGLLDYFVISANR